MQCYDLQKRLDFGQPPAYFCCRYLLLHLRFSRIQVTPSGHLLARRKANKSRMEGSKGEHSPPQSSDQVIPSNLSRPSPTTTKSKYNRGSGLDVVIVGGSELSSQIAFELLRILYFRSVVLLRRSSDRNLHNGFKGEWRAVEYLEDTDEPSQSLLKAVKGANVIISCLGGTGLGAPQRQLVRAAKQSGDCQLFIPSDFSFPHDSVPFSSIYDAKRKVHDLLKRSELPYMSVNCGLFPEVVFHPHSNFGFDVSEKRVTIVGDGNQPVCFTMIVDGERQI